MWCHRFLFTDSLGHKFFFKNHTWYAFSLLSFSLTFIALWSPDFHVLLLRSCYGHRTAETWGVTDHIPSTLFLILGLSTSEREGDRGAAQILPIQIFPAKCVCKWVFSSYILSLFNSQRCRAQTQILTKNWISKMALLLLSRHRSIKFNLFPLQPILQATANIIQYIGSYTESSAHDRILFAKFSRARTAVDFVLRLCPNPHQQVEPQSQRPSPFPEPEPLLLGAEALAGGGSGLGCSQSRPTLLVIGAEWAVV